MELFKWSEDFSVNSEILDNQHKKLFEITNNLYTAFTNKEHKEKLGEIINDLTEYTEYHFREEEKLLKQAGTPLPEEHIQKHHEFIAKTVDFRDKFNAGKIGVTYEIMSFLRNWLVNHIKGMDKEYSVAFD